VIPGTAIVGIFGLILLIVGIWSSYSSLGSETGHYVLVGTVLSSGILAVVILRSSTWKNLMLTKAVTGKVHTLDENLIKVGDTGMSSSRLAPSGKGLINNILVEVHSLGNFIDEKEEIEVVKIEGIKIIVKLKNK